MDVVYTIGHGTRSTEELVAVLAEASVGYLADVRRFPGSRRNPHLARDALEVTLPKAGIGYGWWGEELGGRRSVTETSRHPAWRNAAFRGYADHMDTEVFRTALRRLEDVARDEPSAIMCAETLWWRCHRRLIADALVARGWKVIHLGLGRDQAHELTGSARICEGRPVYDVGVTSALPLDG